MTEFIVAETAIRQLHARYIDALFRKDYAAFDDCFTQDAEWRIAGMILRGRPQIVANAFKNGRPGTTMGIYYERFVEQADRWRFTWRLFQLHYMGPPDLTGSFFQQADYGAPPAMPELGAPTYNYSGPGSA